MRFSFAFGLVVLTSLVLAILLLLFDSYFPTDPAAVQESPPFSSPLSPSDPSAALASSSSSSSSSTSSTSPANPLLNDDEYLYSLLPRRHESSFPEVDPFGLPPTASANFTFSLRSPGLKNVLKIWIDRDTRCLRYKVLDGGGEVVEPSEIFLEVSGMRHQLCRLLVHRHSVRQVDGVWSPLYGEQAHVRDRYNELAVYLGVEEPLLILLARAYEEGVAFRIVLISPRTSKLLWFPGEGQVSLKLSISLHLGQGTLYQDLGGKNPMQGMYLKEEVKEDGGWPFDLPMHPLTIQLDRGAILCLSEARNLGFKSLRYSAERSFQHLLATFEVDGVLPLEDLDTPWYAFILGKNAVELVGNGHLIENLNDPNALGETSWIIPGPMMKTTDFNMPACKWSMNVAKTANFTHLMLGPGWYGQENSRFSNPLHPVLKKGDPLDIPELTRYGRRKGIGLWLYINEIAIRDREEEIILQVSQWGVAGIRLSHVQPFSSDDTKRIVAFVRLCAKHKIMVIVSRHYRPSGLSRTYPNLMQTGGFRTEEDLDSISKFLMLPFARFLVGAGDVRVSLSPKIMTATGRTLTFQICLSLILYSPLPQFLEESLVADLIKKTPEERGHQNIWTNFPVTWAQTRVLDASVARWITVARKTHAGVWYVATVSRDISDFMFNLDFLEEGVEYSMTRYRDMETSQQVGGVRDTGKVLKGDPYSMKVMSGGGDLAVFTPIDLNIPNDEQDQEEEIEEIRDLSLTVPKHSMNILESTAANDSRIYLFDEDPRQYRVCSMSNVCYGADAAYIAIQNPMMRLYWSQLAPQCSSSKGNKPKLCRCFSRNVQLIFVEDLSKVPAHTTQTGQIWLSDHWSPVHSIYIWIQKMILFHSIFLQPSYYSFQPEVRRFALPRSQAMTKVEEHFYKILTSNIQTPIQEAPLLRSDFEGKPICFESVHSSSLFSVGALGTEEVIAMRETLSNFSRPLSPSESVCAKQKVVILKDFDEKKQYRGFANVVEVEAVIKRSFNFTDIQVASLYNTTNEEKARLFAGAALVITSRLESTAFAMFARPHATVIEVAPTFINSDFMVLAQQAGVNYLFSLGGTFVENAQKNKQLEGCNAKFAQCRGEGKCCEANLSCNQSTRDAYEGLKFHAALDSLLISIEESIKLMQSQCKEEWTGPTIPQPSPVNEEQLEEGAQQQAASPENV